MLLRPSRPSSRMVLQLRRHPQASSVRAKGEQEEERRSLLRLLHESTAVRLGSWPTTDTGPATLVERRTRSRHVTSLLRAVSMACALSPYPSSANPRAPFLSPTLPQAPRSLFFMANTDRREMPVLSLISVAFLLGFQSSFDSSLSQIVLCRAVRNSVKQTRGQFVAQS
jgi:hypothetical protein